MRPIFEVAHQMGLVPLAWLVALRSGGKRISRMWWLLAGAFAISWVADWVSHRYGTFPVGPLYLFAQASLIVWTLAPRATALRFLIVLGTTAAFAMQLDPSRPDILVHVVAWLGLLLICWPLVPHLRWTLGVAFGLGGLAWLGYCVRPGWGTWGVYQAMRATSLGLFCRAAWQAA